MQDWTAVLKIQDQARIPELPRKLILKQGQESEAVQITVKTDMRNYSSVLQKSYSTALSSKKIEAAVRKVNGQEDRNDKHFAAVINHARLFFPANGHT